MLNLDELKYFILKLDIYLSKNKNFRKNPRRPPVGGCTRLRLASHADIVLAHHVISPPRGGVHDEPKECLRGRLGCSREGVKVILN